MAAVLDRLTFRDLDEQQPDAAIRGEDHALQGAGLIGIVGVSAIRSTSAHHPDWAKASGESMEVWLIRHVTLNSLSAGFRALELASRSAADKQVRTERIQSGDAQLNHDQCQFRCEFAEHGAYAF